MKNINLYGLDDCLPDDHPLASTTVYCKSCDEMVHCSNNETMQLWVSTPDFLGGFCLKCVIKKDEEGENIFTQ